MKKTMGHNIMLIACVLAILGFGAAFAYHARGHFLWWQDGQASTAGTRTAREIFLGKLSAVAAGADYPNESPFDIIKALTGNPQITAFVHIEGTNISDVVLQAADNEFYLERDMFGEPNINGSLFMDFRNSFDFSDKNTIIYGHNMRNGNMFHDLRHFMSRDFFESHPRITVVTEEKVLIYEIFATFSTHIDFDYIQVSFASYEEFEILVGEIKSRRAFDTGVAVSRYDRILILSTCTNVSENTRFVIAGRLVGQLIINN